MATPFATLTQVKDYLGLRSNDDDNLITRLCLSATDWMQTYLNRDLVPTTYASELRDGTGTSSLMLASFPITQVTSVLINGTALDLSKFIFDNYLLIRTDGGVFTRGLRNIAVSYTAGYLAVPDDMVQACVELVAWRYKEKERVGQSTVAFTSSGQNVTYQTADVPADVKTLLNNYRKVVPV